jgi:pyruvate/2-oxoglutarate dehydrogenase complex dihydrolipoamide acyltransferase (E2) component
MPKIPILMPQLGESIAEATVVRIPFAVGDEVDGDIEVLDVETNKATMGVTTPCRGRIVEWSIELSKSYPVGTTLGWLEVTEEDAKRLGLDAPSPAPIPAHEDSGRKTDASVSESSSVAPLVRGLPVPVHVSGASYLSPRMKARMNELGFRSSDLAGIPGSGAAGRVTIDDLEKYLRHIANTKQTPASTMRVAVADAMRRSWTRPLANVGRNMRIDAMLTDRKKREVKPGPALYALRALAIALGENSAPAGRLIGKKIVHPESIDVGFAVETEDGVLVPVLREADRMPIQKMVARYNELIDLARQRRLPANAQGGSIATVTNFGTFGLEWATPIPLPEQTLLLGLGAGKIVPSWDAAKAAFVPSNEAQITLSFDHRVLDGGAAGRLLARVAELLQKPEAL